MAIDAVSAGAGAYTPQAQTQVRPERPEQSQPKPAAQAQQSERPAQPEQQTKPPPVVNLQGQKTGTVVNTTA